jgi:hypothetical protein
VTARQISSSAVPDAEFRYSDPRPVRTAPLSTDPTEGVSTFEANGRTFPQVDPAALRLMTAEAVHDIAHYLRPAHLQQLRASWVSSSGEASLTPPLVGRAGLAR